MNAPSFGPSRGSAARYVRDHNAPAWGEPSLIHTFEQFRRMPALMPSLEWCIDFGVFCCLRTLLEVLLTPLRIIVQPWSISRRDVLTAYLVLAGLTPFIAVSSDSPMYLYSFWYHAIRGTSILKLYVIFNMCDMCERLLASFNHDATEALWFAINSSGHAGALSSHGRAGGGTASRLRKETGGGGGPASVPEASGFFVVWMLALSFAGTAAHAFLVMLQTVTLNAALNSDDYSLMALLISNNFMEIKSLVFKKCNVEQLFQYVCTDTVERVQQFTYIVVMLLRHAQSQGFGTVQPLDMAMIIIFEIAVDFIKHFFLARFNRISLDVYARFHITIVWDAARTYLADELASRVIVGRGLTPLAADYGAGTTTTMLKKQAATPTPPANSPSTMVTSSDASTSQRAGRPNKTTKNLAGITQSPVSHQPSPPAAAAPAAATVRLSADDRRALRSIHSPDSFVRNPARRLGFTPYAYAAVILWASATCVAQLLATAPLMALVALGCVVALHSLLAELIDGLACRFTLKSNRWQRLASDASSSSAAGPRAVTTPAGVLVKTPPSTRRPGRPEPLGCEPPPLARVPVAEDAFPPTSPPKEDPLHVSDDSQPMAAAERLGRGGGPTAMLRRRRTVAGTSDGSAALPESSSDAGMTPLRRDAQGDAARRGGGMRPSPLLARRNPSSMIALGAPDLTVGSGGGGLLTAASVASSGTTSPQATFTQFAGPSLPPFTLGGSLDERTTLLRGASLAGPPSDVGASHPSPNPATAAIGAMLGRTPPGVESLVPSDPDGDGDGDRDNPWEGIEPMDSVYPFQRVDAGDHHNHHGSQGRTRARQAASRHASAAGGASAARQARQQRRDEVSV